MNNQIIKSLKERFEEKVILIPFSDCHYWTAAINPTGYGWLYVGKETGKRVSTTAHRVSYELYKGPIPDGMMVLHNCDNRLCVNPNHLRLGTNSDNMMDLAMRFKYRVPLELAREIKERLKNGERIVDVAKVFNLPVYHVDNIKRGLSRKYA